MSGDWGFFKLQLAALGGLFFLLMSVTWVVLYYVRLLGHPNDRLSHVLATPKCGGVGVVVSFVVGVFVSQLWSQEYQAGRMVLFAMLVPALITVAFINTSCLIGARNASSIHFYSCSGNIMSLRTIF